MALANKIFLRVFIHTFAGFCQKLKYCRGDASFTFVGEGVTFECSIAQLFDFYWI